jgi:lysophospholipid acyltransferase
MFVVRIRFLFITGVVSRTRYYAAWKLTEGACNLSGFGYTGPDPKNPGQHIWKRAENVDIFGFELAQNPKGFFDSWNMKTAYWLRSCTYLRMVKPGGRPGPFVAIFTYMVSAFWHGFCM